MTTNFNKSKLQLIGFTLLTMLFFSINALAQVTIGSNEAPLNGVILQLQDQTPTTAGGVNSSKGLLLPRVSLTTTTSLQDISKLESETDEMYTGLLVFNTNESAMCEGNDLMKGAYVWNGKKWEFLGKKTMLITRRKELVDNRPGDTPQTYSTVHVQLIRPWDGGVVFDAGEWMSENLRAKVYSSNIVVASGQPTLIMSDAEKVVQRPEVRFRNDENSSFNRWGYFYNTFAAFNGYDMSTLKESEYTKSGFKAPSRVQQGICPEGWRIPTFEDWHNLWRALQNDNYCYYTKPIEGVNYAELSGAFSKDDELFYETMGYRGSSRTIDEGGINIYADRTAAPKGYPSTGYWVTFPVPWEQDDYRGIPLMSPAHVQAGGIATTNWVNQEYNVIRCVKGTVPAQNTYDAKWNFMLPNN